MAVRETKQIGEQVLEVVCSDVSFPIDAQTENIITDLVDTMREAGLVGIAAPQIGYAINIFVAEIRPTESRPDLSDGQLYVCINPTITRSSDETNIGYEGCGSIGRGTLFGQVERPADITLSYFDPEGSEVSTPATGLLSRIFQHEYDHLEGVLFLSRMSDPTKLVDKDVFNADDDLIKFAASSLVIR